MIVKHLILVFASVACSSMLSGQIVPLADVSVQVGMTYSGGTTPVSQSYAAAGSFAFDGMAASVAGSPGASVVVTSPRYGSVFAQVSYNFSVVGPALPDGTIVPLKVTGGLSAAASTTEYASSTAQLSVGTYVDSASMAATENGPAWSGFLTVFAMLSP